MCVGGGGSTVPVYLTLHAATQSVVPGNTEHNNGRIFGKFVLFKATNKHLFHIKTTKGANRDFFLLQITDFDLQS